uniref:Uncharacterized protein n=1 Tax=Clastoptera arizonana TaxID=38151 RepID=A0A1B6E085_9HEMI
MNVEYCKLITKLTFYTLLVIITYVYSLKSSSEEDLPLPELDLRLVEEISNPKLDNGDKAYQMMFQYYNKLYNIYEVVNQDLSFEQQIYELGKEVYKSGGPKFVQIPLVKEKMIAQYKWEEVFFDEFQETVDKIKYLWEMVDRCYKNKAWRTEKEPN